MYGRKENGEKLKEGTDYTIKDGASKFLNLSVGKIYCEMTHAAYPAFKGENVFKTTLVQPIDMPKYELASFTTVTAADSVELSMASPVKVHLFISNGMLMVMLLSIHWILLTKSLELNRKQIPRYVFSLLTNKINSQYLVFHTLRLAKLTSRV